MNTIDFIQVTITPHIAIGGMSMFRIDAQTYKQRYQVMLDVPTDDFMSLFDQMIERAKQEILALIATEQEDAERAKT